MKNFIYSLFLLTSVITFAQVGVNTTTPQEELHIEGTTSTIRVEGLNYPNNPDNLGVRENTRVYVDTDGDLVLAAEPVTFDIVFNPHNYLADPLVTSNNQVIQTGDGGGYSPVGTPRQTGPGFDRFTLDRNAIVEINYSLSYDIYDTANFNVDDSHTRTVQFYVHLRDGSSAGPVVANDVDGNPIGFAGDVGALGYSGQFWSNGDRNDGASGREGVNRQYYATGHDYVKLGPGTYSPMFEAIIFVADASGGGAAKMHVGGGDDEVIIIAHYYD